MRPERDHLREWSRRHGGYDVDRSRAVRGWLALVAVGARPLARRRISPDVVSGLGVLTAIGATVVPRRVGAALVLLSAYADGLDGAVAVRRGISSAHGASVDRLADRTGDVAFAIALRRAGAPAWRCGVAIAGPLALETARRRARRRGVDDVVVVTVGERPMRVALTVAGLLLSPPAGAVALGVAGAAGAVQFARAARRIVPAAL